MARFHVNPETGVPGPCRAVMGLCPFGGPENHYESAEDARAAFELSMAGKQLAKGISKPRGDRSLPGGFKEGDELPVTANLAKTPGESYSLSQGVGITELVISKGDREVFIGGLKALESEAGEQELKEAFGENVRLENGAVHWKDDFGGPVAYVIQEGAIFKGTGTPF